MDDSLRGVFKVIFCVMLLDASSMFYISNYFA